VPARGVRCWLRRQAPPAGHGEDSSLGPHGRVGGVALSGRASPAFTAGPMCASSSDAAATSAPSSSSSSSLAFASADRVVPQPARREEGSHAETEPLLP